MKLFARLCLVAICLVLTVLVVVVGAGAFLLGSETGNKILRERTHASISRLLGPGYVADLGEQTFDVRADGTLAVGWNGVRLAKVGDPGQSTVIEHAGFALRLLPLVGGGLEFGRLEVRGARIDAAPLFDRRDARRAFANLSDATGEAVEALERQLRALNAFQFQTVSFQDIVIEGLPPLPKGLERLRIEFAELRRSGSGSLDLAAALSLGPMPLSLTGEASFRDAGRLESLSLRSSPADLRRIVPPGPADQPADERPFATDADLSVTFGIARSAETDTLVSDLIVTSGPGALQMGRNRTRIEEMQLRLRHREGEARLSILSSPMRFQGVSFEVAGQVEPLADGSPDLRFSLAAPGIVSRAGQAMDDTKPTEGALAIEGVFDPNASRIDLSRMELTSGTAILAGTGRLDLSTDKAASTLRLDGVNLPAKAVKAFWPFNLAGRARQWVLTHLGDEGRVSTAAIALDVTRDRFEGAFGRNGRTRASELRVSLEVEDADLSTHGDLPRLYRANGRVAVEGGRTRIRLDDAMVEGHSAVAVGASVITLSREPSSERRTTLLELDIEAAGAINELLDIANRDPIRALRTLDFKPEDTSGTGNVQASARLRLGDGVAPAETLHSWRVEGRLMDASIAVPVEGRLFSNLSGRFAVRPGSAEAELTGLMDTIPAEISLTLPVGARPSVERLVGIDLNVSAQKAAEIVPAMRGSIEGPTLVALTQNASGLKARLDLTRTSLAIPMIAWRKGPGVAAFADVSVKRNGEETRLENIDLKGTGFSARGSAVIDGAGLRSARLSEVALNPGDAIALSMDRSNNGFTMSIEGSRFDARPLLQELKASAGRARPAGFSGMTFDIAATVDRVRGFGDRVLGDIALNYASHDGRLAALSISGRTGVGGLRVDLSPRGQEQAIRIATEDLGAFVGFAGLYDNMEGGSAVLDVTGTAAGAYRGVINVGGFTLVDEPRLERLVGSEPLPGQGSLSQALGRDLRTSRAYFDQASAALRYADGRLVVENGILRGPVFGSSFAGTLYDRDSRIAITGSFMPAYSVNRIFGAIPLVGRLLGNGNEGGLIGITYQLSGPFASPTLTVNPLSIVAPGVFRQIFEY